MVAHSELQHYKRHYCTTILTGVFGCRWQRYKQSKANSGKCNVAWFTFLVFVLLFIIFWFYFWLMAENSFDLINWFSSRKVGVSYDWYGVLFILTCVTLTYTLLLMALALCHVSLGYQIFMHYVHRVFLVLVFLLCIAFIPLIYEFWREGYALIKISLMMTSPFLHFSAVILLTFLTWFFAGQWISLYTIKAKVIWMTVYVIVMVALYISPLFIRSPCIMSLDELPAKPRMLAHKGASALAPENTMLAFQEATEYDGVFGLESDISISLDGIPFVMHDTDLKRTTNVEDVFPDRVDDSAHMFNMSDLLQLDAGSWFLKADPFDTVSRLSAEDRVRIHAARIPTLTEYAELVMRTGRVLMFDIKVSMAAGDVHPFRDNYTDVIIDTLHQSSLPSHRIWWLYGDRYNHTANFTKVASSGTGLAEQLLHNRSIDQVNVNFNELSWSDIQNYQNHSIKTNVFVVNSKWLFSLYWCMGVESITTDVCQVFEKMQKPVWHMTQVFFQIMWIVVDVLSVMIITILFVVQRMRRSWHCLRTEQSGRITMTPVSRGQKMKEKLLEASMADSLNEVDITPSPHKPAGPIAAAGTSDDDIVVV